MSLFKRLRAPQNDAGADAPEPPVPAVEVRHSVETTTAPASPSTRLRAEADLREHADEVARFRPRLTVREHKPERLAGGCRCGLQAGHPDDCEPRVEATA